MGAVAVNEMVSVNGLKFSVDDEKAVLVGKVKDLIAAKIPERVRQKPVTAIGRGVFKNDSKLKSVKIAATVQTLGSQAFSHCVALERVELPPDLTVINMQAFEGCTALVSVHLPYSLRRIGRRSFAGCSSLVELPHFVKTGPKDESKVIRSIVETALPTALQYIGEAAFQNCSSLKRISIPYQIREIKRSLCEGCTSLESVWLHSRLEAIEDSAFVGCSALDEIKLPASVETVGHRAFEPQTTIVCIKDSRSDQFAVENQNPIRHGYLPDGPIVSQLGVASDNSVADLLDDQEALRGLLDRYEIRPPMLETTVAASEAGEVETEPPRFEYSDGIYRAKVSHRGDKTLTVAMVGDLMCGFRQQRSARQSQPIDFNQSFDHVRPILKSADLAIGNLETMVSPSYPTMDVRMYADDRPNLNAPIEYLAAVRDAGFDAVMSAQNHMYDTGALGVLQTLDSLNRVRLVHGGLYASRDEPRYTLFEARGFTIAVVAYLDPARQRMKQVNFTPEGIDAMASHFDQGRIEADISAARRQGAEFVIAYAHWGTEYTDRITPRQEIFANTLVEAGADYVFGSHSHCPQRYVKLQASDGRVVPVVYSGGNFLSDIRRKKPITQDTFIGSLTLERSSSGNVVISSDGYVPCQIMEEIHPKSDATVVPCEEMLNKGTENEADRAVEALNRIARTMGSNYEPIRIDDFRTPGDKSRRPLITPSFATIHGIEKEETVQDLNPDPPNDYGNNPLTTLAKEPLESALIESEALAYGLHVTRLTPTLFSAMDLAEATIGFRKSGSTLNSMAAFDMCGDKSVAKALLQTQGVPTATGARMPQRGIRSARRFIEQHGWPVVIKPLRGSGGRGVTANITNDEDLRLAIEEADSPRGFLIERHVPGDDYRFLVVGNEVVGIWRKDAANVIGDGSSSVDELIDAKNELRAKNPHLASRLIKKDQLVLNHLARAGRDLGFTPKQREKVYLRSAANLSSGGDNIEITDETHDSLKQVAIQAKNVIPGIELVGVDILMSDHTLPVGDQELNICEINSSPGISAHDFPMFGPPRDVARGHIEFIASKTNTELAEYRRAGRFQFAATGYFEGDGYVAHIRDVANRVNLKVIEISVSDERAVAIFEGTAVSVAALNCLSLKPKPRDARIQLTALRRVS